MGQQRRQFSPEFKDDAVALVRSFPRASVGLTDFLPTIFAAAAIIAANLTIWMDAQVDHPIGVGYPFSRLSDDSVMEI